MPSTCSLGVEWHALRTSSLVLEVSSSLGGESALLSVLPSSLMCNALTAPSYDDPSCKPGDVVRYDQRITLTTLPNEGGQVNDMPHHDMGHE